MNFRIELAFRNKMTDPLLLIAWRRENQRDWPANVPSASCGKKQKLREIQSRPTLTSNGKRNEFLTVSVTDMCSDTLDVRRKLVTVVAAHAESQSAGKKRRRAQAGLLARKEVYYD